jgi:hypothetical protein
VGNLMADVSRFPEGSLAGPFPIATARPIGTLAIISDGPNAGEVHRSTSFPAAGWTSIEGGGGGSDLATTLAAGNTTGGNDIVLTGGDAVSGSAGSVLLLATAATEAAVVGTGHTVGVGKAGTTVMGRNHAVQAVDATIGGNGHNVDDNAYGSSAFGDGHTLGAGAYNAFVAGKSNEVRNLSAGDYGVSGAFAIGGNVQVEAQAGYGSYYSGAMGANSQVLQAANSFAMGSLCNVYGYDAAVLLGQAGGSFAGGKNVDNRSETSFAWGANHDNHQRAVGSTLFGNNKYGNAAGVLLHGALQQVNATAETVGGTQPAFYSLGTGTTAATATECTANGQTPNAWNRLFIRPGFSMSFMAIVQGRQTGGAAGTVGDTATWYFTGRITRDLANNTVLDHIQVLRNHDVSLNSGGTNVLADIYVAGSGTQAPTYSDAGAATWLAEFVADNTQESLRLNVTGEASKNIVWTCHIFAVENGKTT